VRALRRLGLIVLLFMMIIAMTGCGREKMTIADNSIDGMWYVYDDDEDTDMYGKVIMTMDISAKANNDNACYAIRMDDTVDGSIHQNFFGGWYESKRMLKITDKINLQFSWFEYNIAGQWPISLLLDMDGTCTFGDIKTKASRFGYPHRLWNSVTGH